MYMEMTIYMYTLTAFGIKVWDSANKAWPNGLCIMPKRVIHCSWTAHYLEPPLPIFKHVKCLHIIRIEEPFNFQIIYIIY